MNNFPYRKYLVAIIALSTVTALTFSLIVVKDARDYQNECNEFWIEQWEDLCPVPENKFEYSIYNETPDFINVYS